MSGVQHFDFYSQAFRTSQVQSMSGGSSDNPIVQICALGYLCPYVSCDGLSSPLQCLYNIIPSTFPGVQLHQLLTALQSLLLPFVFRSSGLGTAELLLPPVQSWKSAESGFPLMVRIVARSQRVIFRQKSRCFLCCWQKLLQHYVNIVGLFTVSLCISFSVFADNT